MGRTVAAMVGNDPYIEIIAGFDVVTDPSIVFPVYADPAEFIGDSSAAGTADVVVDFSIPAALDALLTFCIDKRIPPVLCTTGYSPEQLASINDAALHIPIFRSGNMSLGINLLADLIRRARSVLGDGYDIEIVERHHKRKMDAPSGTALMLADAAASVMPETPDYIYDRHSRRAPRDSNEIGISSVRGGTIVGEHEVIFAGLDEVIELRHSAASRDVFATGAIKAAKFMAGINKPGLYDMGAVLGAIL